MRTRTHSQAPYLQCWAQNSQANTKLGLFSNRMVCGGEQDKEMLGGAALRCVLGGLVKTQEPF